MRRSLPQSGFNRVNQFNHLTANLSREMRSIFNGSGRFLKFMALYYELQVFKDVYTLVQKVFLYTQEFPREYKYTLGQDNDKSSFNKQPYET